MGGGSSLDKDIRRAYRKMAAHTVVVDVALEGSIPVFHIPRAISGKELDKDDRLKPDKQRRGFKWYRTPKVET